MRIEFATQRRRPLPLTSLIDVIFLLLLFFMLSSTFTRFAEVEVAGGRASSTVAAAQPDILIRIEDGIWTINGRDFPEADAISELKRLQDNGASKAVLLVRGDMTSQTMVSALERVRRATGLMLSVAR